MHFPLKLAVAAVLAKTIIADVTHLPQVQQHPNELDMQDSVRYYNNHEVSFPFYFLKKKKLKIKI